TYTPAGTDMSCHPESIPPGVIVRRGSNPGPECGIREMTVRPSRPTASICFTCPIAAAAPAHAPHAASPYFHIGALQCGGSDTTTSLPSPQAKTQLTQRGH